MSEQPVERPDSGGLPPGMIVGVLLVVAGGLLLGAQLLDYDLGQVGWPLWVLGPGVVLLLLGLSRASLSGLTIAGSIITAVGLILFYGNLTGHWEAWAYAWALVAPGGSGVGMVLQGARSGDRGMAQAGLWQIVTGVAIFVVGFIFFEQIIGISGRRFDLASWVLPALLIGLGVLVLFRGLVERRSET